MYTKLALRVTCSTQLPSNGRARTHKKNTYIPKKLWLSISSSFLDVAHTSKKFLKCSRIPKQFVVRMLKTECVYTLNHLHLVQNFMP